MHKAILHTKRGKYTDTCFYASIFLADKKKIYKSIGDDSEEICFMRSLAKPLQTSILFDDDIIEKLKITDSELAIFSGSHAGSKLHVNKLKQIHKKYGLRIKDLSLISAHPLDKRNYNGRKTKLHNNCSGKHTMMLLMSNYMGFDKDYTNANHPLQRKIRLQQEELSRYKSNILTYDGCSTPLWGLPYKNVVIAYHNLIEKYPQLINAIIKNYYLYGGYNRLDSEIIKLAKGNLFAKVGAGGLLLVYNIQNQQIMLIKMAQDNNEARRLVALYYLNKLGWMMYDIDKNIYNQKKQIVAKYEFSL